ncbi:MAG: hypothetical protein H7Y00_08795 [Fimbriimonadaceae bacterium]|nr:hypothetical protein [Chitinophagales bacterium]
MKRTLIYLAICILLISCSTERGTVEIESLSKKVFEALRDDDFGGIKEIIPNKNNYEKIYAMMGSADSIHIDELYAKFLEVSEKDFNNVRSQFPDWDNAVYAHTNEEVNKVDNVSRTLVTTKFTVDNIAYKITFTGAKINGRWYYYEGMQLLKQEEPIPQ